MRLADDWYDVVFYDDVFSGYDDLSDDDDKIYPEDICNDGVDGQLVWGFAII